MDSKTKLNYEVERRIEEQALKTVEKVETSIGVFEARDQNPKFIAGAHFGISEGIRLCLEELNSLGFSTKDIRKVMEPHMNDVCDAGTWSHFIEKSMREKGLLT